MSDSATDNAREERARRAAERRSTHAHDAWRRERWGWIAAALIVGILVLAVAVDAFASASRIHPGVTVDGVAVGGMSPVAAQGVLAKTLAARAATPVTVTYKGKTWAIKADDIGLTYDYPSLADKAMQVGRTGGFFGIVGGRVGAWFGAAKVPASARVDQAKLSTTLDKVAASTDVAPLDATLKIKGASVTVIPSADGVALERDVLAQRLLAAFGGADRAMTAPVTTSKPKISDAAATQARTVVLEMIAAPATVTFKTKSWTFSRDDVARMIALRAVESTTGPSGSGAQAWVLEPYVSASEASKTIQPKLGVALGKPPVDARFKTTNGAVVIIPSQQGIGPDTEQLATDLTAALKNDPSVPRVVEIKTKIADPALTTAQANAMGIRQRISTFSTTYTSGVRGRVNNIHVLGTALDGKLVPPGGIFSFNGYIGERTAAKGYQEANAIVKGKLVPQLGGGICQVGTTMFNAVFMSGLPVIERQNHSFYISHYPTGRDATVSWGGPDLKWKNTTSNWILISVSYTDGSITISLYGMSPGYDVTYTTGPFTNITPYATQNVPDPTLPAGSKVVMDPGVDGKRVVVTRTVKKNGTVVRTDTFTSDYTPKDATVRVGTKGAASKSATGTPAAKKP